MKSRRFLEKNPGGQICTEGLSLDFAFQLLNNPSCADKL